MGRDRNCERDHRAFIAKVKPLFFKPRVPNVTLGIVRALGGSPDYSVSDVPSQARASEERERRNRAAPRRERGATTLARPLSLCV